MSDDTQEEDIKEGELDVDALDGAFDDHGFGEEEEEDPLLHPAEQDPENEESAEWLTYDDNTDW